SRQRILLPQLLSNASGIGGDRLFQFLSAGHFPTKRLGAHDPLLWRLLGLDGYARDAPQLQHDPLSCHREMATYPLLVSILQIPGRLDAVIVQEQAVLPPDPPHVFYRYLRQKLVYIILYKSSHIEHAAVLRMLLYNLYGHFGKA